MAGYGSFSFLDYNGERSSTSLITGDVTATSLPGLLSEWGTLRTAIENIILGTVVQEQLSVFRTKLSNALPTSPNAQRERKWLVVYEDVTAFFNPPANTVPNEGFRKVFSIEIPTADLTGRLLPNSDEADLSQTTIAAFVTAFEQTARSPHGGNVNVLKIVAVGRNL